MGTSIRIIETFVSLGGSPAQVFAFCLRKSELDRAGEIINRMASKDGPVGVVQVASDSAGFSVYVDDSNSADTARRVVETINSILGTDYVIADGLGSFFHVRGYYGWPEQYEDLMKNSKFVLPYMTES